jgi:hypothetical protein
MEATRPTKHNTLAQAKTQTWGIGSRVDEEPKNLTQDEIVTAGSGDKSYAAR